MQSWHYGKGLIYYRPILRLTKIAFIRARKFYSCFVVVFRSFSQNCTFGAPEQRNVNLHAASSRVKSRVTEVVVGLL